MISIVLVGVGGYGGLIAEEVLKKAESHNSEVVGIVEPFLENSPVKDVVKAQNIKVYSDLSDFYKENKADIAIISTPIHLHKEQCIIALENGSDVLCEKPIAPTLQDAQEMKMCAEKTGRKLHIGFQLSHAPAILRLKEDILNNKFGKFLGAYATICWPRNSVYFARPWAAKAKINGNWVLDSIAMNACAHYLHNMLFLAGDSLEKSAEPEKIGATLYRANPIETYDTALIEVKIKGDISLKFTASHATEENINPLNLLYFEKARVYISEEDGDNSVYAEFLDNRKIQYGATYKDRFKKIWHALETFEGKKEPVCTVDTALPHLKCVNAVSQYFKVNNFEKTVVKNDVICVEGLDKMLVEAFNKNEMPEIFSSNFIDIKNYDFFEGLK